MVKFDENYFYENTTSEIKYLLTTDEQLLWQGKPKKIGIYYKCIFADATCSSYLANL